MTRQKIKIVTNVPLNVTLEETNGKECNSQYTGLEYRYNVLHAGTPSLLYLPAQGAEALRRAGAQEGDDVQITKTMRGNTPLFTVRIFSDATLELPQPPAQPDRFDQHMLAQQAPTGRPETMQQLPQGIRMLAPRQQVAPQSAPAAAPQSIPTVHPLQEVMTRCLEVGCHANLAAYANLRAQGIEIDAPTWEDVRATGISFFIERMKGGR